METGFYFAIVSAMAFAIAQVIVRKSTYRSGESFTALAMTALVGPPVFIILLSALGEWDAFVSFSATQYVLLASAGLVHLIIARFLYFTSTRVIGANPTAAITRSSIVFSVILGVVFLGETVTPWLVTGSIIIMVGSVMTSVDISRDTFRVSGPGLLMGFGTAIASATSAALIRPVMQETDAVYAATFVMYLAAFAGMCLILLASKRQRRTLALKERKTLLAFSAAGLVLVGGHLSRFAALTDTPVSIVQPLIASTVVFVLLFSWIINRKIDVFNWQIIVGILMVLAGVYMITI